ncbi:MULTISPECIES: AMP-binding protein [Aeromonas]|uniref:AMP-binding protein n=1 Tax=Aeromonas TaxID=642 RepID=UPI000CDDC719|nr:MULTISPECIES: AMP-binding protein [Aeromonas]AUZ76421.1 AMP-binding protein [Aeromonas sp. ASNIH4]POU32236.1 AMP-binding protein [Aeromonas hydrophila]POV85738.1 AMP-binding protein [Aeromonas sp. ASNIH6]
MTSLLSYRAGPCDQPLLHQTIGAYLQQIAGRFPDRPAVVVRHQQIRWNYREYLTQIDRLALGLLALGIRPGDRVGIWSPNNIEWCLVQFATARIGAIMVCINPAYRSYELAFAINNVGCRALICASAFKGCDYLTMLGELAPELANCPPGRLVSSRLPSLEMVIRLGEEQSAGMLNFPEVLALGDQQNPAWLARVAATLKPDDAINIQFTSGTTGNPKGATLSHSNILNNGRQVAQGMAFSEQDRLCIPVPLYHCFGMVLGNLASISVGACALFPAEAFDPAATLRMVSEERCTALHGVPTMFIAELELAEFDQFDLSSLRTGIMAGAICPEPLMRKVQTLMHMTEVTIAYGQTECSPINHMTAIDAPLDKRVTTVGRAIGHTEIKLVDPSGEIVAIGERGEICCRSNGVMQGYWQDPVKTAETIDQEGWLHSGDIGIMDEEGYVRIVGRSKELIIRGGENIYPREIEERLYDHPAVLDAAVFGVDSERYGEEVCAWVKLRPRQEASEEELKQFLAARIAYFKVPRYIRFVEEYPMTVTGKLQKFRMRELMSDELARQHAEATG